MFGMTKLVHCQMSREDLERRKANQDKAESLLPVGINRQHPKL